MSALLEIRDLHVAYGKVEAVHDVSLVVDEARIVTVIGPNGAGKTTLLAAIMGLLPSRGGQNARRIACRHLPAVPAACRASGPTRRDPVGWRAANARPGARADGQA